MTIRRACHSAIALALLVLFSSPQGRAADYPTRPIRMILGVDAGTSGDLGARQLMPRLSQILGRNVLVENHPGAGGILAAQTVAGAAPDGYTLLFDNAQHASDASLYKKLPYDPIKDFTPISRVDTQYFVLAVPTTLPVKSVADLIAYAKARPGQLNFASTSDGSAAHLTGALFANMAGLKLVHVPYKGASQAMVDLVGDQVQMMFYTYISLQPLITAGKLHVLATTGPEREPYLPNVPTMQQAGVPGFIASTWHGIYGPAHLPDAITGKLNAAIRQTLADRAVLADMKQSGVEATPSTPAQFAAFTADQIKVYRKLVAISGAKVD